MLTLALTATLTGNVVSIAVIKSRQGPPAMGAFAERAHSTRAQEPGTGQASHAARGRPVPHAGRTTKAPRVAPLKKVRPASVLVTAKRPLDRRTIAAVRGLDGVDAAEVVGTSTMSVGGHDASVLAADPSTFRAYTPKPTAASNGLWRNIAGGDVAVSFRMGNDGKLPLGGRVPVRSTHNKRLRVGGFATVGLAGIDAVISRRTARALGAPTGNGLVLSAPDGDLLELRDRLTAALPEGSEVTLLTRVSKRSQQPANDSFLTHEQVATMLQAARSKLGRPYVWGAEGPNAFDCSGIVQWAFAKAGVEMPRVAAQQALTGPRVPYEQARPGDLVFFRTDPTAPGYISHVGIYIGDGRMIVAPHSGTVVQVQKVDTVSGFAGAVRVNPATAARV